MHFVDFDFACKSLAIWWIFWSVFCSEIQRRFKKEKFVFFDIVQSTSIVDQWL